MKTRLVNIIVLRLVVVMVVAHRGDSGVFPSRIFLDISDLPRIFLDRSALGRFVDPRRGRSENSKTFPSVSHL